MLNVVCAGVRRHEEEFNEVEGAPSTVFIYQFDKKILPFEFSFENLYLLTCYTNTYIFPNYTVNNEQCIPYLFHNQLGFTVIGGHQRPRDITPSVVDAL